MGRSTIPGYSLREHLIVARATAERERQADEYAEISLDRVLKRETFQRPKISKKLWFCRLTGRHPEGHKIVQAVSAGFTAEMAERYAERDWKNWHRNHRLETI